MPGLVGDYPPGVAARVEPMLEALYPDRTAVELAFPIDALFAELLAVINAELRDEAPYGTLNKGQMRSIRAQARAASRGQGRPKYNVFETARLRINKNMFSPLGFSSPLLKSWNIAARYVLAMYRRP